MSNSVQSDASESSAQKLQAAYTLGNLSRTVRLWQRVFWESPDPQAETWDSVPLAIDQLDTALTRLVPETPLGLVAEIRRVLDRMRGQFNHYIGLLQTPSRHGYFNTDPSRTPGEEDWQQLILLADQALAGDQTLQPWYQLGKAVGWYQLELDMSSDHTNPPGTDLPNPEPLFHCLQQLPAGIVSRVPILGRLVDMLPRSGELGLVAFLREVLETCREPSEADPKLAHYYTTRRMRDLDRAISTGLADCPTLPAAVLRTPPPETLPAGLANRATDPVDPQGRQRIEAEASPAERTAQPVQPEWLGWDQATYERNRWIYEQWCAGTKFAAIIRGVRRQSGWDDIDSIAGVKRAGRAYAERRQLPPPPARQRGRPPRSEN